MANEIARANVGQVEVRGESSLGTGTGSWQGIRCESMPAVPASTVKLIENNVAGHRNPLERELPVAVDVYREDAFSITMRIHRESTDGDTPIMSNFFQSAGWQADVGGATVTSGTPTTQAIDVSSATGMAAGECVLIEVTPGVFHPVLVADLTGSTITPSIALSDAPAASEVVEILNSVTPTTSSAYQVPTDKTLQFRVNTHGTYNDATSDLSFLARGCALSSVGALEIGPVGSFPTLEYTFHAGDITPQENDISADSFQDSSHFVVINQDAQFAIANTNSGSGVTSLTTKHFQKLTFNLGLKVMPVPGVGAGGLNGLQAYMLVQDAPTVMIECVYTGDTDYSRKFFDELHSHSSRQYIHFTPPTSDLDNPAFGVWMPNCHLMPGAEPTIDVSRDFITCQATFQATTAAWGGNDDIDEVTSAPIVIGISGEAA